MKKSIHRISKHTTRSESINIRMSSTSFPLSILPPISAGWSVRRSCSRPSSSWASGNWSFSTRKLQLVLQKSERVSPIFRHTWPRGRSRIRNRDRWMRLDAKNFMSLGSEVEVECAFGLVRNKKVFFRFVFVLFDIVIVFILFFWFCYSALQLKLLWIFTEILTFCVLSLTNVYTRVLRFLESGW